MTGRLTRRPGGPARLRELLDAGETVIAPGAFDPLAARLVEEAGFPAVYMTGFGTSAALLGRPDVGLLTMTEMADNAARIAACVDIPLIADADTGYGNPLNVIRTVGVYEAAGVAAIHIEDQVAPKKCGHMDGKQVIGPAEMAQKVSAAVDARTDPNFAIIARTDARAVEGLDSALDRGRRYRDAGADALFIEALVSEAEIEAAARAFPDIPLLFNWAEGGKTPPVALSRLHRTRLPHRDLPDRHAAGGHRRDAPHPGGDRRGRHPGSGARRASDIRRVHRFHRAARGPRDRAALHRGQVRPAALSAEAERTRRRRGSGGASGGFRRHVPGALERVAEGARSGAARSRGRQVHGTRQRGSGG